MINYGGVWSDTWKEVSMQPRVLNEISKEGVLVDEVPRLLVWDIEESNKRTIRSHAGQKGQSSRKRLMRSQHVGLRAAKGRSEVGLGSVDRGGSCWW